MRYISIFIVTILVFGFTVIDSPQNTRIGEVFNVSINDSTEIEIKQIIDKTTNLPLYYSSDLYVPACNTGECKMISLMMYWDIYGNYFKYEVQKDLPLTKYKHNVFKPFEYVKLHLLLSDTSSHFKKLKFAELTEKQALKKAKANVFTGATIKIISHENIKGAVKTTHTLWHIVNGKIQDKIHQSTKRFIEKHETLFNSQTHSFEKENIKTVLENIGSMNLTQIAQLIHEMEDLDLNKRKYRNAFKKSFNFDNIDNNIMVSNLFLRSEQYSKRARKKVKNFPFVK